MQHSSRLLSLTCLVILFSATVQAQQPQSLGAIGVPDQEGIRIIEIIPSGPAEMAGLGVGDVLTTIDGKPIRRIGEKTELMTGKRAGSQLVVTYVRAGHVASAALTLRDAASIPFTKLPDMAKPYSFKRARLGASLQEMKRLFVGDVFGPIDCLPPDTGIIFCNFHSAKRLRRGEVLSFDLLDNKLCRIEFGFPSENLSSVIDDFIATYGEPYRRTDKPDLVVIWRKMGQSITINGKVDELGRSFAVIKDDDLDAKKEERERQVLGRN